MTRQKLAEMMCQLSWVGNHIMFCIFPAYIITHTFPMTSGYLYVNRGLELQPERRCYGFEGRESAGCLHRLVRCSSSQERLLVSWEISYSGALLGRKCLRISSSILLPSKGIIERVSSGCCIESPGSIQVNLSVVAWLASDTRRHNSDGAPC